MPRGRPAARSAATPTTSRLASLGASENGTGRSVRSSSTRSAARSVSGARCTAESPAPPVQRPRGRPSKASLLARNEHAAEPPAADFGIAASMSRRTSGRLSKVSAVGSGSVSSVPTPVEASSDSEYSTPGTSNVATPATADKLPATLTRKGNSSNIEVRLPARSRQPQTTADDTLRDSVRSLKPTSRRNAVIDDSDDGDVEDDEDFYSTPSAIVARRLQMEENAKADHATLPRTVSLRRSGRRSACAAPSPSTAPTKRPRASTGSSTALRGHPAKRSKVIPDSEDAPDSDIDMDAEYAAAAALDTDELADASPAEDQDRLSLPDTDEESDGSYTAGEESDIKPLSSRRSKTSGAKALVPRQNLTGPKKGQTSSQKTEQPPIKSELPNESSGEGFGPSLDESSSALSSVLFSSADDDTDDEAGPPRRPFPMSRETPRVQKERQRLEKNHPFITTMWDDLKGMPILTTGMASQPASISRQLKPFQLEGLSWMKAMEVEKWKGGLLGDEMGLGKTIQAVSLIMSDYPAKSPSLVLVPPVALMQWQSEIKAYTDGTLKTFVYHGTNQKTKGITVKELKKYDIIMMSYNSLESMYRKQEKGFKRKDGIYKEKSVMHSINFHRAILDEAHCIKTRTTMTAKACFALSAKYRWCLTGTPLQNRIGEFFSLIRFLNVKPFASYLCKQCPCSSLEWDMDKDSRCTHCTHASMQHVSLFNHELLNPIQKFANMGPGREAFQKLRLLTERIMLRRLKKDHTNAMELPVKEINVNRQFFGEEENDFAGSIMTSGQRKFDTYVAQGVLLNNYANIFGLIMQMRQVADHPDLLLKKNAEGGQNVLVCCICDEPAEDTVRSRCKHEFCRACVSGYLSSTEEPDCPRCHIPLAIDLEQPEIEQDAGLMKKSSIINRIKMEDWTSSSKIELLVHELHKLRSNNASHKSIIFSQFTTMLQLIEWRLRRAGITTVMLDGSMSPAQRQASIDHFMTNVGVECFLVSLKAGGVALNLTEASRVFIVDPWWNPAAEWQSADRCHRIGQTRPCIITRLCIEDSVESRMVMIQEKKTNMIHSTVNGDDKAMQSLTPADMQFLFRGN